MNDADTAKAAGIIAAEQAERGSTCDDCGGFKPTDLTPGHVFKEMTICSCEGEEC